MRRHSIVVRLNPTDKAKVSLKDKTSLEITLSFDDRNQKLGHGIGEMLNELKGHSMYPEEVAIDLAILAATVTAADTRISRAENAQDSWTREIDLYIPVANPKKWSNNVKLIERMLRFLTGDIWTIEFRSHPEGMTSLIERPPKHANANFDSVCLFSGGLDSFVGAIDLLHEGKNPILVSHYKDASTSKQQECVKKLSQEFKKTDQFHIRANVSFDKNDMLGLEGEQTTRGRSFMFFSLACLAASSLDGNTPIYVPENGLISLNVPPDPLRLGAWSTRTTHPFYMVRWQNLIDKLGIKATLDNPYRFKTKGEMLRDCKRKEFLKGNLDITKSCSSIAKSRFNKGADKRGLIHCGYCTPCLIRRASIHAAFGTDPTEYSIDLYPEPLAAREAESRDVRAFQMISHRLSKNPGIEHMLVHKTGPLNDYSSDDIVEYAKMFERGVKEVGAIVNLAKIKKMK